MTQPQEANADMVSAGRTPAGLVNLGNSCYFNSGLQLLAACPAVKEELKRAQESGSGKGPLAFALQQALHHMNSGGSDQQARNPRRAAPYNPAALHAALCRVAPVFSGHDQHDAQEALHALLDGLQEEATKLHALLSRSASLRGRASEDTSHGAHSPSTPSTPPAPIAGSPLVRTQHTGTLSSDGGSAAQRATGTACSTSPPPPVCPVTSLFRGQLQSSVTCNTCAYTSVTTEQFLELSLPIPTPQQLQQLRASHRAGLGLEGAPVEEEEEEEQAGDVGSRGKIGKGARRKGSKTGQKDGAADSRSGSGPSGVGGQEAGGDTGPQDRTGGSGKACAADKAKATKVQKESQKEVRRRKAEERRATIQAKRQARKGRGSDHDDEGDSSGSDRSESEAVDVPRLLGGMPVCLPPADSDTGPEESCGGPVATEGAGGEGHTLITGFHVVQRSQSAGSSSSGGSGSGSGTGGSPSPCDGGTMQTADAHIAHEPVSEGGLSHLLRHPSISGGHSSHSSPEAAATRAPQRGAVAPVTEGAVSQEPRKLLAKVPDVTDCLQLFCSPETVVWECAEEKRVVRALSASPVGSLGGSVPQALGSLTQTPGTTLLLVPSSSPQLATSPVPAAVLQSPQLSQLVAAQLVAAGAATSTPMDAAQPQLGGPPVPAPAPLSGTPSSPSVGTLVLPPPCDTAAGSLLAVSPSGGGAAGAVVAVSPEVAAALHVLSSTPVAALSSLIPKKVRFSPLPPQIHYIPGSREQRGTDVEAALRGEVPFVRPACAPLPPKLPTAAELRRAAYQASVKPKRKGKGQQDEGGAGRKGGKKGKHAASESDSATGGGGVPEAADNGSGSGSAPEPSRFLAGSSGADAEEGKATKGKKGAKKGSKSEKRAKKREAQRAAAGAGKGADDDATDDGEEGGVDSMEVDERLGRTASVPQAVVPTEGGAEGQAEEVAASLIGEGGSVAQACAAGECEEDVWLSEAARLRSAGPPLARGLLIQAQIDRVDRANVSVRLVAGVSADAKEVAAIMPPRHRSSRRGAPLCRADITAAWERDRSSTAPVHAHPAAAALTPAAAMPVAPSSRREDGDWDQEPDLEDSDERDVCGGSAMEGGVRGTTAEEEGMVLRKNTSQAEDEEDGGEGGGGGEKEEEEELEVMCDVCDSVQVVMDCAAHMVLTLGVARAFEMMGSGVPLRVYHNWGGWRVAGTDTDTRKPWVYPDDFMNEIDDPNDPSSGGVQTEGGVVTAARAATMPVAGAGAELGSAGVSAGDTPRLLGGHRESPSPRTPCPAADTASDTDAQGPDAAGKSSSSQHAQGSPLNPSGSAPQGGGDSDDSDSCQTEVSLWGHQHQGGTDSPTTSSTTESTPTAAQPVPAGHGSHAVALQRAQCGKAVSPQAPGLAGSLSPAHSASLSPLVCSSPRQAGPGRLKRLENSVFQRPATKQFLVKTAPQLLLLHVKRFQMTGASKVGRMGGWTKVDTHVTFPLHLDLTPYVTQTVHAGARLPTGAPVPPSLPTPFAAAQPQCSAGGGAGADAAQGTDPGASGWQREAADGSVSLRYKLLGLIEHQGTMRSGHYVSYVRCDLPPADPSGAAAPRDDAQDLAHHPGATVGKRKGKGRAARGASDAHASAGPAPPLTHTWYLVNDQHVKEVAESKVLGAQAYVLLYEVVPPL